MILANIILLTWWGTEARIDKDNSLKALLLKIKEERGQQLQDVQSREVSVRVFLRG